MGDLNTIGSNSQPRSILSSLTAASLKTGLHKIKLAAHTRVLNSGVSIPTPLEIRAQRHVRSQGLTLLNISDSKSLLTRVEDSLETILDVLSDMKSLAAEAGAIEDGTVYKTGGGNGSQGTNGNAGAQSPLRRAYKDQLTKLSIEIDDIVQDTRYHGKPLLGDDTFLFSFSVDAWNGDTLDISFEPLTAARLSVAADDIRVSDKDEAGATLGSIGNAMTSVQERLNEVVTVKDRLSIKYENLKTSHGIHTAAISPVKNHDAMREQLERTKLRIVDASSLAMLAQANAKNQSTMDLAAAVHRDADGGALARIYSIDKERDSAPVTHLRRIMLGQSSERPALSTFSENDA